MKDGRRRRRAKRARRDAQRLTARDQKTREVDQKASVEAQFADAMRDALAGGHPIGLLSVVSIMIRMTLPDPLSGLRSREREPIDMDCLIASLSHDVSRETTALLAVLAELMLNETDRQDR